MSDKFKKIFTTVMLVLDLALLLFSISELISSVDIELDLFLVAFFAINAYLKYDYIRDLGRKIKLAKDLEEENKREQIIQERLQRINYEMSRKKAQEYEEDLSDVLTRREQNTQQYQREGEY